MRKDKSHIILNPQPPTLNPQPSTLRTLDPPLSTLHFFVYLLTICVAAGIGAAGILNAKPLLSANDRSRWCTVVSLVERGTYRIDDIARVPGWDTIDKVRHEGHFYSTKPALFPTLVAGVYWCVRNTTGWNLLDHTSKVTRVILLCVNLLPMIVAWVLIARLAHRYARSDAAKIFVVVAASVGTLLTTFLVTLNNHTVAAVSVLLAMYAAMRIVVDDSRCPGHFALAGFFAAFTCTNELPAALFGVALFGLLFWKAPKRTLLCFVPFALIPLAAFFYTTYLQTGSWKPFYLYYGTEKYLYVHEGVPSYWTEPRGLDNNHESPLIYLLHCTIGHHGIFSLSPIFLLSLTGWLTIRKWRAFPLRPFLWLGLGLTVAVLGFYVSRTQNYNYGGNSCGLRWAFWLIPFWLVAMIPVLDEWGDRRWFQITAAGLLGVSIFSAIYPLSNPWQHPWLLTLMQDEWGWVDYTDKPPQFDRPLTTWFPTLPDADPNGNRQWIEFAGPDTDGATIRLRLIDAGSDRVDGRVLRRIEVRWNPRRVESSESRVESSRGGSLDSQPSTLNRRVAHYLIDEELFRAGEPPEKFLRWPQAEPSPDRQNAACRFLRGLPRPRPYREGLTRYLKTPLREDAFRCQRAASRVLFQPPGGKSKLWYRCDLWLSDEVPFGVVRVETTVSESRTNAFIARRQLTAVRAGSAR